MPRATAAVAVAPLSIRRILLVVDPSWPSPEAMAWAGRLANAFGAIVDGVTVVPRIPAILRMGSRLASAIGTESGLERLDASGLQVVAGVGRSPLLQGIPFTAHVEHGELSAGILAAERRLRPDLVIVGVEGSAATRQGMESIAETLKHYATASVLIAKAPPSASTGVAAGTDGSPNAVRAVAAAAMLGEGLRWPVEVIEAGTSAAGSLATQEGVPGLGDLQVAEPERLQPVHVRTERPAAGALLMAATRCGLLVMGARGLGPLSGQILGSVSAQVSRESPASVLIVR